MVEILSRFVTEVISVLELLIKIRETNISTFPESENSFVLNSTGPAFHRSRIISNSHLSFGQ